MIRVGRRVGREGRREGREGPTGAQAAQDAYGGEAVPLRRRHAQGEGGDVKTWGKPVMSKRPILIVLALEAVVVLGVLAIVLALT